MYLQDQEWYWVPGPGDDGGQLLFRALGPRGAEGWGDCPCPWPPEQVPPKVQQLRSLLAGYELAQVEELHMLLASVPSQVRLAVESALCSALAAALQVPLYVLWGGAYRAQVPLALEVSWGSWEESAPGTALGQWLDRGFRTLVLPAPWKPPEVWSQWEQALVPRRASLQVVLDAQGTPPPSRWTWPKQLLPLVACVLDLTGQDDPQSWQTLRSGSPVPVWVARDVQSPQQVFELTAQRAVDGLALDPFRLGGWLQLRRCVAVAEAAGVPVMLDLRRAWSPAVAVAVHLTAAEKSLSRPMLLTTQAWEHPPGGSSLAPGSEAMLAVPREPGSYSGLDRSALEEFLVM